MKNTLTLITLSLLIFVISACGAAPTAEPVAAITDTVAPVSTATPEPATATPVPPTATPIPPTDTPVPAPSVDDLAAHLLAELYPDGVPAENPDRPWGIREATAEPLTVAAGQQPLWLAYTLGIADLDLNQVQIAAIYTVADGKWQELARTELTDADMMQPGTLTQLQLEPKNIWLELNTMVGAHSGIYKLLKFDGQTIETVLNNFNASPGAGNSADLDNDGTPEILLNLTDPYVFCYACGVRTPGTAVWQWNGSELVEITLTDLPADSPADVRDLNNSAVKLANGWLWKDAQIAIDQALEIAPDDTTVQWNRRLITMQTEALLEQLTYAESYPLLLHLFYGDYPAVMDIIRAYPVKDIFSTATPLVAETMASGWEQALHDWIFNATNAALAVDHELAAGYFLQGWAAYLIDPADPTVGPSLEKAVQFAPDDPFYADCLAYLPNAPTSLSIEGMSFNAVDMKLIGSGYSAERREYSVGEIAYVAIIYTHTDWYANPNYLLVVNLGAEEPEILYTVIDEFRRMSFTTYTPQGEQSLEWGDMNGDSLLDIAYRVDQGGNCWACSQLKVIQLQADGTVINLTEDTLPAEDELGDGFVLGQLADVDGDGTTEWLVGDVRWEFAFDLCHACSPHGTRIYAWDGETYRNASDQFPDFYQAEIDRLKTEVDAIVSGTEAWSGFELGPMVSLLLNYQNSGRADEGLAIFDQLTQVEQYGNRLTDEQKSSVAEARAAFGLE